MNADNYPNTILERTELIKKCLLDYNYPLYATFSEDERIKALSIENFPNLIKWLFVKIDDNYQHLLNDATKEKLANMICQHGFCTNTQKFEFIHGKLPHNGTVEIMYRMFKFLKDFKDLTKTSNIPANINIEDYLKDLQANDTNLFPGEKLKFTPKEVQMKLKEYQAEIDHLEQTVSNDQTLNFTDFPVQELKCLLEEMKLNLNLFKIKTANLLSHKVEDEQAFTSKYSNLGEEFDVELVKLNQLIQDTQKIFNIKPPNSENCAKFNLALVKEKLAILNNLIEDFDNSD